MNRWVRAGVLALVLFVINVIGRLISRLGNITDLNDQDTVATAGLDGTVRLASLRTGQAVRTLTLPPPEKDEPTRPANAIGVSPDGRRLVVASAHGPPRGGRGLLVGWDLSTALIWRPFMQQNIVVRISAATLRPADGFKQLFPDETPYSILTNLVLTY